MYRVSVYLLICGLLSLSNGAGAVQEISAPHAEIYREAVVGIALYPDGETPPSRHGRRLPKPPPVVSP